MSRTLCLDILFFIIRSMRRYREHRLPYYRLPQSNPSYCDVLGKVVRFIPRSGLPYNTPSLFSILFCEYTSASYIDSSATRRSPLIWALHGSCGVLGLSTFIHHVVRIPVKCTRVWCCLEISGPCYGSIHLVIWVSIAPLPTVLNLWIYNAWARQGQHCLLYCV